eukprot:12533-Pelagococcus_subviridis.AAC.8
MRREKSSRKGVTAPTRSHGDRRVERTGAVAPLLQREGRHRGGAGGDRGRDLAARVRGGARERGEERAEPVEDRREHLRRERVQKVRLRAVHLHEGVIRRVERHDDVVQGASVAEVGGVVLRVLNLGVRHFVSVVEERDVGFHRFRLVHRERADFDERLSSGEEGGGTR